MKSTNYEPPHYVVFSRFFLLTLSQVQIFSTASLTLTLNVCSLLQVSSQAFMADWNSHILWLTYSAIYNTK
jgi:hypothetical protein